MVFLYFIYIYDNNYNVQLLPVLNCKSDSTQYKCYITQSYIDSGMFKIGSRESDSMPV